MKISATTFILLAVIIVVIVGYFGYHKIHQNQDTQTLTTSTSTTGSTTGQAGWSIEEVATYQCANNVSLKATFHKRSVKIQTTPNEPPQPTGSVTLELSDGQTLDLPQTISADGVRYADANDTFVFWSKGNSALIQQNGSSSSSYRNCIVVAPEIDNLTQIFYSQDLGLTLRYPSGWQLAPTSSSDVGGLTSKVDVIADITVPESMTKDTNLGTDSGVRVAQLPQVDTCTPNMFLTDAGAVGTSTLNGVTYLVSSTEDAGAGNRYSLTAYVKESVQPCIAVITYIHTSVLENYPAGTVGAYDATAFTNDFAAIRDSIKVAQPQ
jgi:membrane-bound inhibitor of C-type lysozyme